jgi:hypothetical protein
MKQYSLRLNSKPKFSESSQFYDKYHFRLKIESIQVGSSKIKCLCVDSVNEDKVSKYELRTVKGVFSSRDLNNDEILLNYKISRSYIKSGDVLYAFYTDITGIIVYGEDINSMDELYNCTMNPEELHFTFVSPILYKLLVQEDYKETGHRRTTSQFKDVRQVWDYENPCLYCKFVFLKSQTTAFRKKCCANGRFVKKELYNFIADLKIMEL